MNHFHLRVRPTEQRNGFHEIRKFTTCFTSVTLRATNNPAHVEPVFYETSAASFGLQAGAQSSEAVVLLMTSKAWFARHLQEAKGVYIVPKLTKGAFIFGVEGGNGVGAWTARRRLPLI